MLNKKKIAFNLLYLIILTLLLLVLISIFDNRIIIQKDKNYIYADGISSVFYKIVYINKIKNGLTPFKGNYDIENRQNIEKIKVIKSDDGFFIESKFEPCSVDFNIVVNKNKFDEHLKLLADTSDFDQDGIPDVAELITESDRNSFVEWFVSIAESQYYKESVKWEKIHHDCAGLINFCFKEALKKHDNEWYKNFPYLINKDIPDVKRYNYPEVPLLDDMVFRTETGVFKPEDITNNVFQPGANANNLLNFNLTYIGKSISLLKKGDLIFFNVIQNIPEVFHTMIYTGNEDYLIYHTGRIDETNEGEVRKVKLQDLFLHPDKNWHPETANPGFLGIYRWKILS